MTHIAVVLRVNWKLLIGGLAWTLIGARCGNIQYGRTRYFNHRPIRVIGLLSLVDLIDQVIRWGVVRRECRIVWMMARWVWTLWWAGWRVRGVKKARRQTSSQQLNACRVGWRLMHRGRCWRKDYGCWHRRWRLRQWRARGVWGLDTTRIWVDRG